MGSHRVGHDWSDLAATAAADINMIPMQSLHTERNYIFWIYDLFEYMAYLNIWPIWKWSMPALPTVRYRKAWHATVHRVTESWTWLHNWTTVYVKVNFTTWPISFMIYMKKLTCPKNCMLCLYTIKTVFLEVNNWYFLWMWLCLC